MVPVKPLVLSRMASISFRIDASERLDHPPRAGDRTERTAAETAAHDADGKADHFPRRQLGVAIAGMGGAGIGRVVDRVHFRRRQRDRRRLTHTSCRRGAAPGRGRWTRCFQMQRARGVGVKRRVGGHRLERRQPHHHALALGHARGVVHVGPVGDAPPLGDGVADGDGAANVLHRPDRLAGGGAGGDLDDGAFGVAIDQDVGLGVEQQRAAHLVRPVIVMGDAAQRRLDAAQNHGHVLVRLAAALGIDQGGAVGPSAALAAGGIGDVGTDAPVRGV